MIFFASSASTWKSQCGKYLLAAFPDGTTRVTVETDRNGSVTAGKGPLKAAVEFCQARERRMGAD